MYCCCCCYSYFCFREILELMEQVEETRQREIAAKIREDKLKEHFNMEAADADTAIGKYGTTSYK